MVFSSAWQSLHLQQKWLQHSRAAHAGCPCRTPYVCTLFYMQPSWLGLGSKIQEDPAQAAVIWVSRHGLAAGQLSLAASGPAVCTASKPAIRKGASFVADLTATADCLAAAQGGLGGQPGLCLSSGAVDLLSTGGAPSLALKTQPGQQLRSERGAPWQSLTLQALALRLIPNPEHLGLYPSQPQKLIRQQRTGHHAAWKPDRSQTGGLGFLLWTT